MDSTLSTSLLRHRVILLSGPVDSCSAGRIISSLLLLDAHHHGKPIDLYINSSGGTTADGLAVIDAMQGVRAPVRTICIGQAANIAALILAAGTRGLRYATPHAAVCIANVDAMDVRFPSLLASFIDRSEDDVRQAMGTSYPMTAQDAVAFGIIDCIIQRSIKAISVSVPIHV